MFYLVYKITNNCNGKHYIGAHKTLDKNDSYFGSGKLLDYALKKYGKENFKKEILFEASSVEEMFSKEKELVVLGPDSYNLKAGGEGGWDHLTEADWEKRAQSKRGCKHPPRSEISKARCAKAMLGNTNKRGKKLSVEGKKNLLFSGTCFSKGHIPWNKGKSKSRISQSK
jgi:hypothetical protein